MSTPKEHRYGKILVVDDDEDILIAARLLLKQHVALVHTEKNPEIIPSRIKSEGYDVILLDMNFTKDTTTGKEGFIWLENIMQIDPTVVVILITAFGDVEMAVRAVKEGATDFILKPWQNEKLLATVNSALKLRETRAEVSALKERQQVLSDNIDQRFQNLIGVSQQMMKVFDTISKVAATDANVLVLGENGTGKELVSRAIHRQSERSGEVFITVDMGALSDTLFESELFGYKKGAFTDAKQDKPGRFEVADKGTLFLDEIGNLSLANQVKLLNVLERREVVRLGDTKSKSIDIRLICATNRNLQEMVAKGEFRQDLLYRINTVEINIPPLRERKDDIPLLVEHYLSKFAKKYGKPDIRLGGATMAKLMHYPWPGNIRELQHSLERAVILADSMILHPTDFFLVAPNHGGDDELMSMDSLNLDEVERKVIEKAMRKHGGNIKRAADDLGLTRTSLYRRLEKYGL